MIFVDLTLYLEDPRKREKTDYLYGIPSVLVTKRSLDTLRLRSYSKQSIVIAGSVSRLRLPPGSTPDWQGDRCDRMP